MTLLDRLQELVRKRSRDLSPSEPLDLDIPLSQLGIESLEVVALIADIEDTLGMELPLEYLTFETFKTTRAIWQTLQGLIPDR